MAVHIRSRHPHVSIADNEALWKITQAEQRDMKKKWTERYNIKATRRGKKKVVAPLVISAAHSSHLVLRNDDEDLEGDDNVVPGGEVYDETPEEDGDNDNAPGDDLCNDMLGGNVDDDSVPGDDCDETPEDVDEVSVQDGNDNWGGSPRHNGFLGSSWEKEMASSDQHTVEELTEAELVSQM